MQILSRPWKVDVGDESPVQREILSCLVAPSAVFEASDSPSHWYQAVAALGGAEEGRASPMDRRERSG